jgi:hypothetical protein
MIIFGYPTDQLLDKRDNKGCKVSVVGYGWFVRTSPRLLFVPHANGKEARPKINLVFNRLELVYVHIKPNWINPIKSTQTRKEKKTHLTGYGGGLDKNEQLVRGKSGRLRG